MGFTESQLTVSEDSNEVELTLRSNIPLQDSGVLIRVSTEANTAQGQWRMWKNGMKLTNRQTDRQMII